MSLEILTYSAGSSFTSCEQKYRFRYEQGYRPKGQDTEALFIGKLFHEGWEIMQTADTPGPFAFSAALEHVKTKVEEVPAIGDQVVKQDQMIGKIGAMLMIARKRWPENPTMTEQIIDCPIYNPETKSQSRTFRLGGKLDNVVGNVLVDFKTVSDPVQYETMSQLSYQMECYAIGLIETFGLVPESTVYRLVKKPTISLCKKDNFDRDAYMERCYDWFHQDDSRENPIDASKVREHEVYFNVGRIDEARYWLWNLTQRILENRRSGRWMMNPTACEAPGRSCEFYSVCKAKAFGDDYQSLLDQWFEIVEDTHPELQPTNPE